MHIAESASIVSSTEKNIQVAYDDIPGVPKKVMDLIKASVRNRARINRKSSLNYSLIVNLKIDTVPCLLKLEH